MSGGFFRGTSADQDTRFSNKQAKLLKSQKFAPELDQLVDMRKVNMEVIKPWITKRVTELLGFEDEVLINFIHGLLDSKEVNGKEVQIQITGFMEKNTRKFMKELWTLLVSAQQTVSGVPRQLLEAKLEDLQKKNMKNDHIACEIQRKKGRESDREIEPGSLKKMDDGFDPKETGVNVGRVSKVRDGDHYPQDGNEVYKSNSVKERKSRRSRSISGSPSGSRGRSLSRERKYNSPWRRRFISPRRRCSPLRFPSPRRRPSYSRHRSRSRSLQRSPTSTCRRIRPPLYHRSPSPSQRSRSPSPVLRRRSPPNRRWRKPSPIRRLRSPSPIRRRRSPSPIRRRRSPSPIKRRRSPSPAMHKSPVHLKRRSYSPLYGSRSPGQARYRKSPTPRKRSPPLQCRSPVPGRRKLSNPPRERSASVDEWSSQSLVRRTSPSPRRKSSKSQGSPVRSSRDRIRHNLSPELCQPPGSVRSPLTNREEYHLKNNPQVSLSSPQMSPGSARSPQVRKRSVSENRSSNSPFERPERLTAEKLTREIRLSPLQKHREQKPKHDSPETSENEEINNSRRYNNKKSKSLPKDCVYLSPGHIRKDSTPKVLDEENSSGRSDLHPRLKSFYHYDKTQARKGGLEGRSDKPSQQKSSLSKGSLFSRRLDATSPIDVKLSDEKGRHRSRNANDSDGRCKSQAMLESGVKTDNANLTAVKSSCSEKSNEHKSEEKNRRKHKRSERKELESDEGSGSDSDSELEDKMEAKRRKKERKLRKEEKRRRREERRCRRRQRRAEKLKMKNKRDESLDGEEVVRRDYRQVDEEPPYEHKKLEIELGNKALESFKAKSFGH